MLDDEDKQMIIALENSILLRHLDSEPITKTQWCRYCYAKNSWNSRIEHKEDCPISLIANIRKKNGIENWFSRLIQEQYPMDK